MTLSQRRREAVYAAIHREVVDLRLRLIHDFGLPIREEVTRLDVAIAQKETVIFRAVLMALGVPDA